MHLLTQAIRLANDVLLIRLSGHQTRKDRKCFRDVDRDFRVDNAGRSVFTAKIGLGLGLQVFS